MFRAARVFAGDLNDGVAFAVGTGPAVATPVPVVIGSAVQRVGVDFGGVHELRAGELEAQGRRVTLPVVLRATRSSKARRASSRGYAAWTIGFSALAAVSLNISAKGSA
jgi:hypothetical protein